MGNMVLVAHIYFSFLFELYLFLSSVVLLYLIFQIYGVKEFVCLSVTKFDPNYLRTGKTGVCNFSCQSCFCKPVFFFKNS